MKRVFLFLFALAVAVGASTVAYGAIGSTNPQFHLDATALTAGSIATPFANTGLAGGYWAPESGNPTVTTVDGLQAVQFTAAPSLLLTSDAAGTTSQMCPMSLIKLTSGTVKYTVYAWLYRQASGGGEAYLSWAPYSRGTCFQYIGGNNAGVDNYQAGGFVNYSPLPARGEWHFVATTYDGTTTKLYVDGAQQGSQANAFAADNPSSYYPVRIGCGQDSDRTTYAPSTVTRIRQFGGSIAKLDVYDVDATAAEITALWTANSKTITASATAGGSISPTGALNVVTGASKTYTITKNYGYTVNVVVDGVSMGDLSTYTFTNVTGAHTIAANFSVLPTHALSGNVTAAPGGGATVSVKSSPTGLPIQTTTTDLSGNYSFAAVPEGTSYVCASQTGYMISPDTTVVVAADTSGINFTLTAGRNIPQMERLLFAADSTSMGDPSTSGNWPLLYSTYPGISTLTAVNTPLVTKIRGIKYELNSRVDGDGYRLNTVADTAAIPTLGATIVAVVKPVRNTTADSFNPVVSVYYGNIMLGVFNNTGIVRVRRTNTDYNSVTAIPDGQLTILSLVVQPDGQFTVYASAWNDTTKSFNAPTSILSTTTTSTFTAFTPNTGGTNGYRQNIMVGRNDNGSAYVFNGYIGDVFVYKCALSPADRAILEADINTKTTSVTTYNITATAGAGGSISPTGVTAVGINDNQTYTITPNFGYDVTDVLVDGVSVGAVTTYTFSNVTATHTIAVTFAAKPTYAVTGQVTDSVSGSGLPYAKVYFSATANASLSPSFVVTADASGNFSANVFNNAWFVCASQDTHATSADTTVTVAGAPLAGITLPLVANGRSIPAKDQLLFSTLTSSFTATQDAAIPTWAVNHPLGRAALTQLGTPTVDLLDGGTPWAKIVRTEADGFQVMSFTGLSIPINGLTYTTVVKPLYNTTSDAWSAVFELCYHKLCLSVARNTGVVSIMRNDNGFTNTGYTIPDGQKTILSLTVGADGAYTLYANGLSVATGAALGTGAYTVLAPFVDNQWGTFANLRIGRGTDDWSTFNGDIGDAFFYKKVLTPLERIQLETDLGARFGITTPVYHNITASAGVGGTISPSDVVPVREAADQTFTITPNIGYRIDQVLVDGVNDPTAVSTGTYTFPAVATTHTIAATFAALPTHTISGKVVNKATGAGISGATVYFSASPNACVTSYATTTADGSGNYTQTLYEGAVYVAASASGYYNSPDVPVSLTANVTGANLKVVSNARHTPRTGDLLFAGVTDGFPTTNGAAIGSWLRYDLPTAPMTPMGNPTVAYVDNIPWENNSRASSTGYNALPAVTEGTGYTVNGAAIVCAVQPVRNGTSEAYSEVVSVLLNKLSICVDNGTGNISVGRGAGNFGPNFNTGVAIPDGQKSILSLIVQPTGQAKLFVNGAQAWSTDTTYDMTNLIVAIGAGWNVETNIGKGWHNDPWSAYNGKIGDVFVYKTPLTDTERQTLEWDLYDKFGIGGDAVTISGQVLDGNNGEAPVSGAQVVVQVGGVDVPTIAAVTDSTGHYTAQARLAPGTSFTVHATKLNFQPGDSTPPTLFDGSTTTFTGVNVIVASITTINISGTVTDFISGAPVAGLKLLVNVPDMPANYPVTTGTGGTYSVAVASSYNTYIIGLDPTNSPLPVMLTALADRTITAPYGVYTDVTGKDLLVSYPSTITGKVVTSDYSAASGFAVVATDETGAAKSATTASDGTYSISVLPGFNYTVIAKKSGYVTMPGPQSVNVSAGNTNYPVGDFTAIPTTISGVLKDAATGQPIYNGVVQSGTGPTSSAVVTDNTGAFTLPAIGCGGIELFGDALNYHCKNYFVTGSGATGAVKKNIALTAETETGVITNGSFENVVSGQPTDWVEKWGTGGMTFASSTDVPDAFSGAYSVWYTATAQYDALAHYVALQPNSLYTFYFKAKADAEVTSWFPMVSFRGDYTDPDTSEVSTDQERKGWISGETGYDGWSHTPPYTWMQYLKFHTYSGDAIQPFVRIAPPASSSAWTVDNIAATFCYAAVPTVGKGCYVDDVVIDRVAANEPLETVGADLETPVANLAELKAKAGSGETVSLSGVVTVASKGSGRFFIGEELYKGTIMVAANGHSVPAAGSYVTTLKGVVTKDAYNQYTLTLSADPVAATTGTVLKAVGANNRSAKTDAKLVTNLVRVWGSVSGSTIDDGYGNPVTVKDASLGTGCVAVSGVLWKDTDGSVVLYQNLP